MITLRKITIATYLSALFCAAVALGWTPPATVSDLVHDVQWPRLCPAADGGMHLIWRWRFKPWLISYRFRDAGGNWTPIETPIAMTFQDTPWLIEDELGRPHMFFAGGPNGSWPEDWTQIWEAYKQNGTWTVQQVTPSEDTHQGYPRVVMDAQKRLHMVYLKVNLNRSVRASVKYRVRVNGIWSGEMDLGQIENFYYQQPYIARDATDNIHVTWVDLGGTRNQVKYRRQSGGVWGPALTVGSSVGNSFIVFPHVVVAGTSTILVTADDGGDGSPAHVKGAFSTDDGLSFGAFASIVQGTYGGTAVDSAGSIRMAYSWPGELITGYTQWSGGAWTAPQQITTSTAWQLSQDSAVDKAGMVHVVFENNVNNNNVHAISYMNNGIAPPAPQTGTVSGVVRDQNGLPVADAGVSTSGAVSVGSGAGGAYSLTSPVGTYTVTATRWGYTNTVMPNVTVAPGQTTTLDITINGQPPAAVTAFTAMAGTTTNTLTWTNPTSPYFSGTRIVYRTDEPPAGPTDGTPLADDAAQPGSTGTLTHNGLVGGTTCYYAAFAYHQDASRFYAAAAVASATPAMRPDFDRDGDVDQSDFGHLQACFSGSTVPQYDPACQDAKFDSDLDVDGDDLSALLKCFNGAGKAYGPLCGS